MPSSNPETIAVVIELVWKIAPKRLLDVGAGYGKYGVLFREYLELRHRQSLGPELKNRTIWENRLVRIDALEGFGRYVGQLHKVVYDNVYVENIIDFLQKDWDYDFIFLGDILEHIDKSSAQELLSELVSRAKMGVLVSVPRRNSQQGAEFGNSLEEHRSSWSSQDFYKLAPFACVGFKGNHLISFLTNDVQYYRMARENVIRRKLRAMKRAVIDSW